VKEKGGGVGNFCSWLDSGSLSEGVTATMVESENSGNSGIDGKLDKTSRRSLRDESEDDNDSGEDKGK